jgi:MFS family permease
MYLPMNFLSIWLIENKGLRVCVVVGSTIMIVGSVMRFVSVFHSSWWWFFGHIVCMSSQAYLKNPVTKIASNWFGDKERGTATAIGIVSGPLGIFISKVLILAIFDDKDKYLPALQGNTVEVSREHFHTFIAIHSILSVALVIPALFLIREKPPSPPSMVATKPRPKQTFAESFHGLVSNVNYMLIFIYFNCVNSVSIYNAEIEPFTNKYQFLLIEQIGASMLNCVAGIAGSIILGKYLDKYKLFKSFQIMLGIAIPITILITFLMLHFNAPNIMVVLISILAGGPLSSVSVVSYQFAAEVVYPVSEVQAVSMMNVVNKLVTLLVVKLTTALVDDTPSHIYYMYGFILWICLPLIGLIPAYLVEEDLRRLNMRDVQKSAYVEEKELLMKTEIQRQEYYKSHRVMANQ